MEIVSFLSNNKEFISLAGVFVAIAALIIQQRRSAKQSSAQMANHYNDQLLKSPFKEISGSIGDSNDAKKILVIDNQKITNREKLEIKENDFENYLSELETIGLLINQSVIKINFGYELFDSQFTELFSNKYAIDFMKKSRLVQDDLWDNLQTAYSKMNKHRKMKNFLKKFTLKGQSLNDKLDELYLDSIKN